MYFFESFTMNWTFVAAPATNDWERPKTLLFSSDGTSPGQPRNDCAVQERQLPLPVGFDRYIVAEKGAKIVEAAFFMCHGDQLPVAVSGGES